MLKSDFKDVGIQRDSLFGIFRGVVEDRNDPEKLGRCRIRIFGIHSNEKNQTDNDGIPTEHLPWAEPAMSLVEGSVSGFGLWSVPLQGSHVFVFFENGNVMQPRFFASAPGKPTANSDNSMGFNDPNGEYPDKTRVGESDFHRLARNENINKTSVQYRTNNLKTGVQTSKGESWSEPNPAYNSKYPDNIVLATHNGISVEIDTTDGEQRVTIFHPSNTFIEIDKEGNFIVKNDKDSYEIVMKDKKVYIERNCDSTVNGNRTDNIKGDDTEKVGTNQRVTIGANQDITVGGNCTILVSGTCTIRAATILLN